MFNIDVNDLGKKANGKVRPMTGVPYMHSRLNKSETVGILLGPDGAPIKLGDTGTNNKSRVKQDNKRDKSFDLKTRKNNRLRVKSGQLMNYIKKVEKSYGMGGDQEEIEAVNKTQAKEKKDKQFYMKGNFTNYPGNIMAAGNDYLYKKHPYLQVI